MLMDLLEIYRKRLDPWKFETSNSFGLLQLFSNIITISLNISDKSHSLL